MSRWAAVLASILILHPISGRAADSAKESYVEKANRELKAWNAKTTQLQKKTEAAGSRTRVDMDRHLKTVEEKMEVARHKLVEFENSSEGSWKSLRRGVDKTIHDVKVAFDKAASYFNKTENKKEN